ncbi:DUF2917 domain-containing protein [Diaphorobacter aerolatus]|uniref:DUF2917 domain-containing protein n=1 Tax=Diaphorobacter aerolatus TaxID=1288495 RepID=A0A7H0GNP8_9BURK|nr:DUF2917 domain-containing protein [Diaphorobacter aerolatus]QNP49914.1 DUF2917 domain-containing protein [Diaphorobacter aerolatus]
MNTLRAGQAVSLRGRRPMQLRLLDGSGSAWVTRTGSSSTAFPPEDLILVAGQTLHLGPREHWVMEPAAAHAVRYQWK